jgi:hypothetical protein
MTQTIRLLNSGEDQKDKTSSRVLLCGKSFIADKTGALYWPAEDTLAVSDLRLEKGSYLSETNVVLPPFDTTSAFDKLEQALDRYNPARVIALGDSFCGEGSLCPHDVDWLHDLMHGREWYWIMGPNSAPPPEGVGGAVAPHVTLSGIKFRHEPVKAPVSQEIAGRMHPVATISENDYTVSGRCFVSNGVRIVLPSVGQYGRGENVLGDAFEPLLGRNGLFVWVVAHERVRQVAAGQLLAN